MDNTQEDIHNQPRCLPQDCQRVVLDGFLSKEENAAVLEIAKKGFAYSSTAAEYGGPTIMDINSGFVRDQDGLINMYTPSQPPNPNDKALHEKRYMPPVSFTTGEYALYKTIIQRIRQQIMDEFDLEDLYFTAPTFITREVGNASSWKPKSMHDEYWHPHVDKNNTAHYDYSGLVYLNDHGLDYTGGMFAFLDGPRSSQKMPCYDEDLKAMGAPQSCSEFAVAGFCDRDVGGSVVADYCPESCGRCKNDYKPPHPILQNATGDNYDVMKKDIEYPFVWDAALDFDFTEDGETHLEGQSTHLVEPSSGRLVIFSSGQENVHQVCLFKQLSSYSFWIAFKKHCHMSLYCGL